VGHPRTTDPFQAGNVLCRIFGCGERKKTNFNDLWQRGKIDEILSITKDRLASHPSDVDSLYFRTKALIASGLHESARASIERLMVVEPSLTPACKEWLAAIERQQASDS
jgi:hypothetical protein